MDAYLAKPLQSRELFATVARLLGTSAGAGAAATPSADAPAGVVDEARLLERVGGDRKALRGLVRLFLADAPKQTARIRRAVEARDARGLRDAAHALKGAVSNFAAPAATEAAMRLQRIGEAGDLTAGRSALAVLDRELRRVKAALRRLAPAPAATRAKARPRRK
jgi:HPt (histidine-containing phosphotransfer) domain-containing protein